VLQTIAIQNYRSLRELRLDLGRLTVVTGANGTGKSSLYRGLRLLADSARGNVVSSLAREGGLQSTLWAGPAVVGKAVRRGEHEVQGTVRKAPVSLQMGFASDDFSYLIDLGIPPRDERSAFNADPEIKRELVWSGEVMRPSSLLVRRVRQSVLLRDDSRRSTEWVEATSSMRSYDSVLTELVDPVRAPELLAVREQVRSWRFYDHFRTDPAAPARQPQIGTRTPVLDSDGRHLAAALQTIVEVGDVSALQTTITDAFGRSTFAVTESNGRFDLSFSQHGLLRPLNGAELSDGTLRYLLLVAALLSPRPPGLMVLNEPETSLHPDLLAPLARLIVAASEHTQIVVVSHATGLVHELQREPEARVVELVKDFGETRVSGLGPLESPPWNWGHR
jgi:predicted ATPase